MQPAYIYYNKTHGIFSVVFCVVFGFIFLIEALSDNSVYLVWGFLACAALVFLVAAKVWKSALRHALRNDPAIVFDHHGISGILVKRQFAWADIEKVAVLSDGESRRLGIALKDRDCFLLSGFSPKERVAIRGAYIYSGFHFSFSLLYVKERGTSLEQISRDFSRYYGLMQ